MFDGYMKLKVVILIPYIYYSFANLHLAWE